MKVSKLIKDLLNGNLDVLVGECVVEGGMTNKLRSIGAYQDKGIWYFPNHPEFTLSFKPTNRKATYLVTVSRVELDGISLEIKNFIAKGYKHLALRANAKEYLANSSKWIAKNSIRWKNKSLPLEISLSRNGTYYLTNHSI